MAALKFSVRVSNVREQCLGCVLNVVLLMGKSWMGVCVCLSLRERETVCVCVCVCLCSDLEKDVVSVAQMKRGQVLTFEVVAGNTHIIQAFTPAIRGASAHMVHFHEIWIECGP